MKIPLKINSKTTLHTNKYFKRNLELFVDEPFLKPEDIRCGAELLGVKGTFCNCGRCERDFQIDPDTLGVWACTNCNKAFVYDKYKTNPESFPCPVPGCNGQLEHHADSLLDPVTSTQAQELCYCKDKYLCDFCFDQQASTRPDHEDYEEKLAQFCADDSNWLSSADKKIHYHEVHTLSESGLGSSPYCPNCAKLIASSSLDYPAPKKLSGYNDFKSFSYPFQDIIKYVDVAESKEPLPITGYICENCGLFLSYCPTLSYESSTWEKYNKDQFKSDLKNYWKSYITKYDAAGSSGGYGDGNPYSYIYICECGTVFRSQTDIENNPVRNVICPDCGSWLCADCWTASHTSDSLTQWIPAGNPMENGKYYCDPERYYTDPTSHYRE